MSVLPHLALLGGGYVLSRLASSLEMGSFVITSRSSEKVKKFKEKGFTAEVLDITDSGQLRVFFEKYPQINTILDSIPPLYSTPQPENNPEQLTAGIRSILSEASVLPLQRIIYLSTTGVFGVCDGSVVHENTNTNPIHWKSEARLASEQLYRAQGDAGISVSVLRLPAIYGPGRGIGTALKLGRFRNPAGAGLWSNRIHVCDLASILALILRGETGLTVPPVVCVSDGNPVLYDELIEYYCAEFSLPQPSTISKSEISAEKLSYFMTNQRVSNALLLKVTGIELKYPSYREGAVTEFEAEHE